MKNIIKQSILESKAIAVLEYNAEVTIKNYGLNKLFAALWADTSNEVYAIKQKISSLPRIDEKMPKEEEEAELIKRKTEAVLELFKVFEKVDPTPNHAYVQFIAQNYAKGGWGAKVEDLMSEVRPAITKFEQLKKKNKIKAPWNDILKYKDTVNEQGTTINGLQNFVFKMDEFGMADPGEDEDAGKYRKVFENDQVIIIEELDKIAGAYFGKKSSWCTRRLDMGYFDSYHQKGPLWVFFPTHPAKSQYSSNFKEQYQANFTPTSIELRDEGDNLVPDYDYLFLERFGNLSAVLNPVLPPEYKYKLGYTPDGTLAAIVNTFLKLVMEYAHAQFPEKDESWFATLEKVLSIRPARVKEVGIKLSTNMSSKYIDYIVADELRQATQLGEAECRALSMFVKKQIVMKEINGYYFPVLLD